MMSVKSGIVFLFTVICAVHAFAVEPDEILDDPALEARAREISRELRCITCQSQSIDDSDAPLAKDLRLIVRERVMAGDSNAEIIAYATDRYGDYVRLKPALRADTAVLWLTPAIVFLGAFGAAGLYFWRLQKKEDPPSNKDQAAKQELGG